MSASTEAAELLLNLGPSRVGKFPCCEPTLGLSVTSYHESVPDSAALPALILFKVLHWSSFLLPPSSLRKQE